MHDIEISWPGGTARFAPSDAPVSIGRSFSADVPLQHPSVSRIHLELDWNDHSWTANDRSTHGTYDPIGVRLTDSWPVGTAVVVRLGGVAGEEVSLRPVSRNSSVSRLPATSDESDATVVDLRPPPKPAMPPAAPSPAFSPDPPVEESDTDPTKVLAQAEPKPERAADSEDEPSAEVAAESDTVASAGGGLILEDPQPEALQWVDEFSRIDEADDDDSAGTPAGAGVFDTKATVGGAASGLLLGDDEDVPQPGPAATQVRTASLRLTLDDQDYEFDPGTVVTVGRDPSCLVHVDERHSLVSRRHLQIFHDNGSWWLEDHSSKGTWVDGSIIRSPYRAEGAFVANLGDREAGTQLRLITAGEHRQPRDYTIPVAIGAGLVVLALMTWLVMAVLGGGDTEPDFDQAKRSSVMLIGEDGLGSGFFVDDDLIVTNQHVASLADQMFVAVTRDIDEPAVIEYVAEPIEFHPFLDIAVMRIIGRAELADGRASTLAGDVGSIGLPVADIGDSANLTLGDEIYSVGFPEQFWYSGPDSLPSASPILGEATAFAIWPGCDNRNWESFIPDDAPVGVTCSATGDIHRGQLVATMTTGRGASGSAVYHNGEVVSVVFAGDDTPNKVLTIGANSFEGWLAEVIAGS